MTPYADQPRVRAERRRVGRPRDSRERSRSAAVDRPAGRSLDLSADRGGPVAGSSPLAAASS